MALTTTNPVTVAQLPKGGSSITTPNFGTVKLGKKGTKQIAMADYQGFLNQQAIDKQTEANRADQVNPFGSVNWAQDPTTGKWTQTTNLNEQSQKALDSQQRIQAGLSGTAEGMLGNIGDTYSKSMDWGGLPQGPTGAPTAPGMGDFQQAGTGQQMNEGIDLNGLSAMPQADDATRQRVEDAMYQRAKSRLDPRFEQEGKSQLDRLYAMGGREGDTGFERQQGNLARDKNDAYNDAAFRAIEGGGAEQSRLFDLGMQTRKEDYGEQSANSQAANAARQAEFNNSLAGTDQYNNLQQQSFGNELTSQDQQMKIREQAIQDALRQRNQPLNEMTALLSGREVSGPQFNAYAQAGAADPSDVYGAYQDNQARIAAQAAAKNQMIGSLAGSAMGMFSFGGG